MIRTTDSSISLNLLYSIYLDTISNKNTILWTGAFDVWLTKLKDARGKARIIERIRSAERDNFGDCGSIGHGVSEMRIHFGPGYRVYFTRVGDVVYILAVAPNIGNNVISPRLKKW